MDYQELKQLEISLLDAADQLCANPKLTAGEYSMPDEAFLISEFGLDTQTRLMTSANKEF